MFSRLLVLLSLLLQVLSVPSSENLKSRATCTNPSVRKEWRSFTSAQKTQWLNAVKCLGSKPHDKSLDSIIPPPGQPLLNHTSSLYDDLVYVHIDLYPLIHFVGIFFPWHRWFLDTFEKRMRNDCGYTGPMGYWDWTKDASNFPGSAMWDGNAQSGLGGLGKAANDFYLSDGALKDFIVAYPTPHKLQRNYSDTPFDENRLQPTPWLVTKPQTSIATVITPENVKSLYTSNTGDFVKFYTTLDTPEGVHTAVHLGVGGDLQDAAHSPNDPMFFLHHGMLDRIWWLWQNNDPANKRAFGGGSVPSVLTLQAYQAFPAGTPPNVDENTVMPNDNFGTVAQVKDVLDTQGGYLCYTYE